MTSGGTSSASGLTSASPPPHDEQASAAERSTIFARTETGIYACVRRTALLLVLALLVIGGCGGDEKRDFLDEANANCRERQRTEVAAADRPTERPDAWLEIYDREAEKQRRLEAPEELRRDWERYLQRMDAMREAYRDVYRFDDGTEYNERSVAQGAATRAAVQARQIARRIGLDVCGKQIY